MERILLYYPTINIPDQYWLRNSLLYTDKVSSIFPYENMLDMRVNDDMRLLYDEEQYVPISALNEINKNKEGLKDFEDGVLHTLKSKDFKKLKKEMVDYKLLNNQEYADYTMCLNKISPRVREFMLDKELLVEISWEEGMLERNTAAVYMAHLANFLASVNDNLVTPSTDDHEFERIAFQLDKEKLPTNQLYLDACLPTPTPLVTVLDIVKFKKKRRQELLKFRNQFDDYESKIRLAESEEEKKYQIIKFKEMAEYELGEIKKLLGDSRMDFALNGLSSLLDFKKPEIAGTIATGAIGAAAIATISSIAIGAGAVILTATLVSSYKRLKRQAAANAFSYVYYARKEGIIN